MNVFRRRVRTFTLDWMSGALLTLFVAFQTAALAVASLFIHDSAASGASQSANPGDGVSIIAIAAVEIAILILAWRLWKRLPKRYRKTLKTLGKYGLFTAGYFYGLFIFWTQDIVILYVIGLPVFYALFRRLGSAGLTWLVFNLLAFVFGILAVTAAGVNLAPVVVGIILVAATIWDVVAVDFSDIMGDLVKLSSAARLPNFFIIPTQLRFDFDVVQDLLRGDTKDKPESIGFLIGLGDFIFPTLLLVSAAIQLGAVGTPVIAGVIGTAIAALALRDSLARANSGLPALPWVNSGALIGLVVGAAIAGVPFVQIFGL